jgi:hypothetical protein
MSNSQCLINAVTGQVNFCDEPFRDLRQVGEKRDSSCGYDPFVAYKGRCPKTVLFEASPAALLGKRTFNLSDRRGNGDFGQTVVFGHLSGYATYQELARRHFPEADFSPGIIPR